MPKNQPNLVNKNEEASRNRTIEHDQPLQSTSEMVAQQQPLGLNDLSNQVVMI